MFTHSLGFGHVKVSDLGHNEKPLYIPNPFEGEEEKGIYVDFKTLIRALHIRRLFVAPWGVRSHYKMDVYIVRWI